MRQSVRFCVYEEEDRRVSRGRPEPRLRTLLPELLEDSRLDRKEAAGSRRASNDRARGARPGPSSARSARTPLAR